jgi:hypothetical protein
MKGYKKTAKFSKKRIDTLPEFNFQPYEEEITTLKNLCELVKDEKLKEIAQATKNYIIIRLAGIIENELKACVPKIIDSFEIAPSQILGNNRVVEVDLDRFEEFTDKEITKGKIVTLQYQLTNVYGINDVFSGLNNVKNFFYWWENVMKLPESMFNYVKNFGAERNDVIHNLKDCEKEPDELISIIDTLQGFVKLSFAITCANIAIEKKIEKEKIQKMWEKIRLDKTISLTEFEKITKKRKK